MKGNCQLKFFYQLFIYLFICLFIYFEPMLFAKLTNSWNSVLGL